MNIEAYFAKTEWGCLRDLKMNKCAHSQEFTKVTRYLYVNYSPYKKKISMHAEIFLILFKCEKKLEGNRNRNLKVHKCILDAHTNIPCLEIHKYKFNSCCDIYIQTIECAFTNCLSFLNSTAFMCKTCETPQTRTNSKIHCFKLAIVCSQSDVTFLYSQSHDHIATASKND